MEMQAELLGGICLVWNTAMQDWIHDPIARMCSNFVQRVVNEKRIRWVAAPEKLQSAHDHTQNVEIQERRHTSDHQAGRGMQGTANVPRATNHLEVQTPK
jgi:hypothetical protein